MIDPNNLGKTPTSKTIKLKIQQGNEMSSAISFGNTLINYQKLIYEIGDHLSGGHSRSAGDFPKHIKNDFLLKISYLKIGSAEAGLQIETPQVPIIGMPSFADRVIDESCSIFKQINEGNCCPDDFLKGYDTQRRLNILTDIDSIWPDEADEDVSITAEECEDFLDKSKKGNLEIMLNEFKESVSDQKHTHFGMFIRFSADINKIIVDTPSGKCTFKYKENEENNLKSLILNFIELETQNNQLISIKKSDEFLLDSFLNPKIPLKIEIPIPFKVVFEDEMYFIENDVLDIFSYDKDMRKAREDMELQLFALWEDYIFEDESKFSESGKLYKTLLLKYMGAKND
jgi:hypothetical protein